MVTDSHLRRRVEKFQKRWNQAASDEEEVKEGRKGWGKAREASRQDSAATRPRDPRRGPEEDYTPPMMTVAQPLQALADSVNAGMPFSPHAGAGGGAGAGRDGRPWRRGGREVEAIVPPSVPVILGVNADEGLMFVYGIFPVSMHQVPGPAAVACCVPSLPMHVAGDDYSSVGQSLDRS